jgi:hypothetical protein
VKGEVEGEDLTWSPSGLEEEDDDSCSPTATLGYLLFRGGRGFSSFTQVLAHHDMALWNPVHYVSANDVIINLADPAMVRGTNLPRNVQGVGIKMTLTIFKTIAGRSPKVGASCYIDAVVNKGKESHGCFLMSWKIHP